MITNLCFYDDFWLDCRRNVDRTWHEPRFIGSFQDPDCDLATYPSLAWCPEAGEYRLWYEAIPDTDRAGVRMMGLAVSSDGRNWRPAQVTTGDPCNREHRHWIYSGEGGIHGSSVFRDPWDPDPARRYKWTGMDRADAIASAPKGCYPLTLSASPDGIRWTRQERPVLYPFLSDTYNRLFWNPVTGRYGVVMRAGYVDRRICLIESEDLIHWTDPALIVHPDAEYRDGLFSMELYGMGVRWNEGMFLGLLMRFHTSLIDEDLVKMSGTMDTELMYSYDGRYWMHTTRQPLIRRPPSPQYGYNQLYALDMAQSPDGSEMILSAVATRNPHLSADEYKALRRRVGKLSRFEFYSIRKDGFCALESGGPGGKVITKAFELMDGGLTLNISAATGRARLAILDDGGRPYPGFALEDSLLDGCDGTAVTPRWRDHDLRELAGRRVRFCTALDGAALYSIRGNFRPWIACPQTSISNPLQLMADREYDGEIHPFAPACHKE